MQSITPHINVRDAAEAIDFYKQAFGAKELGCHAMPSGKRCTLRSESAKLDAFIFVTTPTRLHM
jgi:uncharacterized glyoxalase superfamily protein PhnB